MKIPKNKALELIDEKILQFQKVLADATYDNRYNEAYEFGILWHRNFIDRVVLKRRGNELP